MYGIARDGGVVLCVRVALRRDLCVGDHLLQRLGYVAGVQRWPRLISLHGPRWRPDLLLGNPCVKQSVWDIEPEFTAIGWRDARSKLNHGPLVQVRLMEYTIPTGVTEPSDNCAANLVSFKNPAGLLFHRRHHGQQHALLGLREQNTPHWQSSGLKRDQGSVDPYAACFPDLADRTVQAGPPDIGDGMQAIRITQIDQGIPELYLFEGRPDLDGRLVHRAPRRTGRRTVNPFAAGETTDQHDKVARLWLTPLSG